MSKSIDILLKELIESQATQTVALNEKLTMLAGEKDTYTDRMKKMEDGLTEAMKKVIEMDASIKEFHKSMECKVCDMENKYSTLYQKPSEDEVSPEDKKEDDKEMTDKEDEKSAKGKFDGGFTEKPVTHLGKDDMKDKEAENMIDGVNKTQVTGQPEDGKHMQKKKQKGKPASIPSKDETEKTPMAEEVVEEPKAEEIIETPVATEEPKEVKAEESVPAPVASDAHGITELTKALDSKIEKALEKLASVTTPKVAEESISIKNALAAETKAKEEAVAHFKALNEKFESLLAKVNGIEINAKSVEQKAAQIVASHGVEAVAISVDSAAPVAQTDEDMFKQFEALKGADQRKFYLANKAVIERHASALLRAKRS